MLEYLPLFLAWLNVVLGGLGGVMILRDSRLYGFRRSLKVITGIVLLYLAVLFLGVPLGLGGVVLSQYFLRSAVALLLGTIIANHLAERPRGG